MALRIGQIAPDFQRRSDDGQLIHLSALRGQWVVLYFYPRAGTPGCSLEAQRFQAALPEFERLHAQVIGVSMDTEAHQANFRDHCQLTFPMIPDSGGDLSRAYGVVGLLGGLLSMTNRETYLLNPEGRIAYHHRSANPSTHVSNLLQELEHQQAAR